MITIPLYFILIVYFILLFVLIVFFITNICHIILTGTTTFASFLITLFILALSILVLFAAWYLLQDTNWNQPITIWNPNWINPPQHIFN